ncbi:hypothetical protein EYB26_009317 [Talaromyces marneffei]|uniref:uncharacterized protein n=1 Tax=Talaromyces marneffei TaxID=37727 RepID=UPI0012AA9F14|nr:uncharacterized protein EYB26_009317 [Talaromyces marneffei]QGA21606.1 hypothetical protein EYB26_009317 [Talaromyces marneffei]
MNGKHGHSRCRRDPWVMFEPIQNQPQMILICSNYLAGSYGIYASSALSSNTVFGSILGGILPLAGPKMYQDVTPFWGVTLLGLVELHLFA